MTDFLQKTRNEKERTVRRRRRPGREDERKMRNKIGQGSQTVSGRKNILENIFIVVLAFYPLCHIGWGLDLMDTGYHYANFRYMGTEHMDPMWFFSTYLANAVGNLLTKLPGGCTLLGMNLYTGLFGSVLALGGYFFCTRCLKIPQGIAFVGELVAVSLYWCPTAALYNYLTYLLFLGCCILLYYGLTKERKGCLIAAGICLGVNVLVRLPNLSEAAMILAVWAYDVILWLEERGSRKRAVRGQAENGGAREKRAMGESGAKAPVFWRRLLGHTGWCLCGYAASLAVLLGWIQIRYGLAEYAKGISRLFGMTDNAADYKPTAMLMGMFDTYIENMYWAARIGVILAGGLLFFAAAGFLEGLFERIAAKAGGSAADGALKRPDNAEESDAGEGWLLAARILRTAVRILWIVVSAAMLWWLYMRKFCTLEFFAYASMLRPGVLFLMLTLLICGINVLRGGSSREERLISGMLILIIFLTPLGSNNKLFPAMNNLCVAAPYTLWQSWRFVRNTRDRKFRYGVLSPFPAKGLLAAFLAMCLFQFGGFGAGFVFAEGTGVQDVSAKVENNPVLKNIGMSPQKAGWMTEIQDYIEREGIQGNEVILYGNIPALSFYLQMPSAFNPWSSLDSYSTAAMEEALAEVAAEIDASAQPEKTPVIIVEWEYALYWEGGASALEAADVDEVQRAKIEGDKKLSLLSDFMKEQGYQKTFDNGKFVVYER